MQKNKIQKILLKHAEINRQFMILGAVLFLTGIMSASLFVSVRAGTTDNTNVNLNVTAGALNLDEAPVNLNFSDAGVGSSSTSNTGSGADNGIIVNDTSGDNNGWTLSAYYNTDFTSAGASTMTINDDNKLLANVNEIDVISGTGLNTDVAVGANFNFNDVGAGAVNTVATAASEHGQGSVNLYNFTMKYNVPIDATATNYTTEMIFTVA